MCVTTCTYLYEGSRLRQAAATKATTTAATAAFAPTTKQQRGSARRSSPVALQAALAEARPEEAPL
jgi:hypothetical protein